MVYHPSLMALEITATRWDPGAGFALYPPDRRFVVFRSCGSSGRDDDLGLGMDCDIEVDDYGRPHCKRFEVRALGDGEVTGAMLRQIPVAEWVGKSLAAIAFEVHPPDAKDERVRLTPGVPPAEVTGFRENMRRPRRGSPLTDEHLQQVADLYRDALARRLPNPTETIADDMHAARSTAARWVALARQRGLLGESLRGRAGEAPRKEN
jgi:hypothetical protein